MQLFKKMSEPVFLKESTELQKQLEKLRELEPLLTEEGQILLRKDIKCLEYGIQGENNIVFELKNSHMPMYILQDIYLKAGELSAQIDFMVFTKKMCFVIECKNLYGDIEITKEGDFVRTLNVGGKIIKEGFYSPVTQNERHMQLMKKIKSDNKSNFFTRMLAQKYFEDFNQPIVVLANPKTVINTKQAKKDIKDKVIRADQLITYIKEMHAKSKEPESSENMMLKWAQSYLEINQEMTTEYTSKYEKYKIGECQQESLKKESIEGYIPLEDTMLYQELKQYRLNKSREEKIKPYFIYNNKELEALINKMPISLNEIEVVQGFGKVKVEKYGEDLLEIFNKHR